MTGADVLSFIVGLLALSAFSVVAIVLTIFLVWETELPETGYHPAGLLDESGQGFKLPPGLSGCATVPVKPRTQTRSAD